MPESSSDSAIMEELESLFAWNPLQFQLATKEMGGSLSTYTRDPAWYDMHLAPDRICKRLVHVKDLHKKIAAVVDDKLCKIRNDGITLEPPTVINFVRKEIRDVRLKRTNQPTKNEECLREYYKACTAEFCIPVASALALHPTTWASHIRWSSSPIAKGNAICDGSLQVLTMLNYNKRQICRTRKHVGPDYIDPSLWNELMEVREKYGDLATWEMKNLSVGDVRTMLGIVAMAGGVAEPFSWKTCNDPHHPEGKKKHFAPPTIQLLDDPSTMSKFGLDDPQLISTSLQQSDLNVYSDMSLRRGGSSLENAVKCDQQLMARAKGFYLEETQEDGVPSSETEDLVSTTVLNSATRQASQAVENSPDLVDPKPIKTPMDVLRYVLRKLWQDDLGSSTNAVNHSHRKSRSVTQKSSVGLSLKPGVSNLPFVAPENLLKRKGTRSKSPKKKSTQVQTNEGAEGGLEKGAGGGAKPKSPPIKRKTTRLNSMKETTQVQKYKDTEDGLEVSAGGDTNQKDPLAGQSIVRQAWSQAVRAQSTVLIIHSGNYEYVCIRHRATQTLYVSDILHVPFLENPGYGKLQIGIYLTALDDALGRNRLEKVQAVNVDSSGDNDDPDPGPSDRGGSDHADDDDTDEPKPKRRKGSGSERKNSRSSRRGDKDWGTRLATNRDVLMVHVTYGVYDSIHPAVFNRGSCYPGIYGLCTPPSSPLYLPKENNRFELFLTSEIGEQTAGILHGGVIEIESDKKSASFEVIAKLAFTNEHRRKLTHESSMYTFLESKGIKGIPTALGIFSEAGETGPLCFITSHAGTSLQERKLPITANQRSRFLAILESIHDAGVLHDNLRSDNLLVDDSGGVAIVNFSEARQCPDANLIHKETQSLHGLLKAAVDDAAQEMTNRVY